MYSCRHCSIRFWTVCFGVVEEGERGSEETKKRVRLRVGEGSDRGCVCSALRL